MTFFYVKNGGTCSDTSGAYGTQKTGSWATAFSATNQYYNTIRHCMFYNTVTDGDIIFCSDQHYIDTGADYAPINNYAGYGAGVMIISVDDAAIDEYKPGAYEDFATASQSNQLARFVALFGFRLTTSNSFHSSQSYPCCAHLYDCTYHTDGQYNPDYASRWSWLNALFEFNGTATTCGFQILSCNVSIHGAKVVGTASADQNNVFRGSYSTDRWLMNGVIFSRDVGSTVFTDVWAYPSYSLVGNIELFNCQWLLASEYGAMGSLSCSDMLKFRRTCTTDSSTDNPYDFIEYAPGGTMVIDSSVYRTGDLEFYNDVAHSFRIDTSSACGWGTPFRADLLMSYADLSDTNTDVLTLHLTSDVPLTDAEFFAWVMYEDGTDPMVAQIASSGGASGGRYPVGWGGGGTALTTTSGEWTNGLTYQYKVVVDTSVNPGGRGPVMVGIEVKVASATIHVATELEYA